MAEDGVTFTTKEMLAKLDSKLDAISQQLIGKADLAALVTINLNLEDQQRRLIDLASRLQILETTGAGPEHERRITKLEKSDAIYESQSRDRRYLYGALLLLISVLVAVGGLIVSVK